MKAGSELGLTAYETRLLKEVREQEREIERLKAARDDAERLLTPVTFRPQGGIRDHRDWVDARIEWHRLHGDAELAHAMRKDQDALRAVTDGEQA